MELVDLLKDNCKNIRKNLRQPILEAINGLENQLNRDCINLVFLGNYNSGKKTMIDSINSCLTNNYDNLQLISSKFRNSYFPIVIERGNNYYISIYKSNKRQFYFSSISAQGIIQQLEEYDNKTNYFRDLENYERDTDEEKRKELKNKIKEIIIKIEIPNFPSYLRLIDYPSFESKTLTERVYKLINENCIFSVFIYLISFTQEKLTFNGMIYEFFKEIKDNYHNSIFCLCLTKYDSFVEDYLKGSKYYKPHHNPEKQRDKNREANRYISKFKDQMNYIKEISNYVNISKIFIINNKYILDESPSLHEYPRKQVNNFFKYIDTLKSKKWESIKRVYFINSMRIKLCEIINKDSYLFNQEKYDILKKSYKHFEDELKTWKKRFPSSYEKFKDRYKSEINTFKKSFKRNDITILKHKSYAIRDSYIKDQYQLLLPEMTLLIKNDIINLIRLDYCILNIELLCYPMFGGEGNGFYGFTNTIGLWIRQNCFDDTLEFFYNSTTFL